MTKTIPVGRKVVVEVPATTANLGPGFDTLGMALTIHDTLTATVVDTPGIRVDVHGVGKAKYPLMRRTSSPARWLTLLLPRKSLSPVFTWRHTT